MFLFALSPSTLNFFFPPPINLVVEHSNCADVLFFTAGQNDTHGGSFENTSWILTTGNLETWWIFTTGFETVALKTGIPEVSYDIPIFNDYIS